MQRAALTVSNNIAEGFELGTTRQLLTFIYHAKGSAAEARSMLCIIERVKSFEHLRSEISELRGLSERISRQINGGARSLQNSGVNGVRCLTDAVRAERARRERAGALLREVERYRVRGSERDGGMGGTAE